MDATLKTRRPQTERPGRLKVRDIESPSGASQAKELALAELEGHLGYFLRRLQIEVFSHFIRTLSPMKVRPAQYSVLVLIAANPGRSQAAIGGKLNIERARLARLLHELERRKWIERRSSSGDGRSHALFLTSAGEKALVQIKALTKRHEDQLRDMVGPDRRSALMKLLKDFG
jgi:DNA-binding MarR family transcriptional regulator